MPNSSFIFIFKIELNFFKGINFKFSILKLDKK